MPADALIVHVAPLTDAVAGVLSYLVPEDLKGKVSEGVVVIVPLRSRLVAGVVMSLHTPEEHTRAANPEKPYTLKPLHMVVDEQPALNSTQLSLARWMAREYCAPLGRCCGLMVPPGFTPSTAYLYALAKEDQPIPASGAPQDARAQIIDVLHRHGPLVESKLKTALKGVKRWRGALRGLVQAGVVLRSSTLEPSVARPRRTTMAQLALSDATLEIVFGNLGREADGAPRRANAINRRKAVLTYLQDHSRMAWADWVFAETGANRADLDWLAERNYILLGDSERWRDPLADIDYVASSAPPLTTDQARAWEAVRAVMSQGAEEQGSVPGVPGLGEGEQGGAGANLPLILSPLHRRSTASPAQFLVRGVTGSGKTEVYMRAVDLALQRGCGALVLVPEISLTPQTARRFLARFPGQVALIHSRLKPGERFDTWRRIRAGELKVVVGARSALFAPLPAVGVIVLDEEHDQSYKQSSPPYYDTRRVAMHYAEVSGATLLLGSATPSLEAWQMAQEGALKVLELPNRVRGHVKRVSDQQTRLGVQSVAQRETDTVVYQPLPDVQIVDMRAELRGGNLSMFSGALTQALSETLQRGEQAILFLNRRGSASCVICRQCGYVLRCPNDDVPLTYHQVSDTEAGARASKRGAPQQNGAILKCHQCDHVESVPTKCPACGSARIRFIGIGTQRVEQAIQEHFPHARIVRWDKDASSGAGRSSADQLLQRFVNQQADVLVGTQMIAKGLDLPLVTLVGVVLADVGLFLPDFRSSERVFDLIEQVAGRAGRSLLAGRVIVQTYNPEHPAIAFAAHHDVAGFARDELRQRKTLNLPPYVRLVRFEVSHDDKEKARQACEMLARQLRRRVDQPGDLIGPAQAYFARRARHYRWHLFARTQSPRQLLDKLELPRDCVVDVDPVSVL
jgi:primosomal protein N' (replication factor Y)